MSARLLEGFKTVHPVRDKSLGHFFFNCSTKYSKNICQIDGTNNTSETYGSVKQRSVRLAIALQKRNVKPGDVIAVCSKNTLDNIIPILGGLYVGAALANFDPVLPARHIKHLLGLVEPKIIFVDEECLHLIELCLDNNGKTEIIVFGLSSKYETFPNLIKQEEKEEEFVPVNVNLDDVALMFCSSGTTGFPKAICHTHNNYFPIIDQACYIGWDKDVLHFTTFYWMTAMMILLGCFYRGSYRIFCSNNEAEEIFRIIETYKVKTMFMAPVLSYKLTRFENPNKYNTSTLKIMSVGGSYVTANQIEKLRKIFPTARVNQVYGMTEIGVITAFHPYQDFEIGNRKPSSSGKLGPDMKLKVIDPYTGKMLPPNQKGEICIWSPSLMKGYYKTDLSDVFDDDGYLKTGDEGYYDDDGCIYIIERIKEMFKYKSYPIIPSSVEAVLLEHPAIKEVVVFGIPHEEYGDIPAACVVLKNDFAIEEKEIDQFLSERVSDLEKLRGGVTFVKSLPQTPTGKNVRREIRNFVMKLKNK